MRDLRRKTSFLGAVLLTAAAAAAADEPDPPQQVARISYLSGPVSLKAASLDDWSPAEQNRPVTVGDGLWMDDGSRAELKTANAAIRIDQRTNVDVLNLGDSGVQLRIPRGTVEVKLRSASVEEAFEIATPAGAVLLKGPGWYRVDVSESGTDTTITALRGQSSVVSSGAKISVKQGEKALVVEGQPPVYDVASADPQDDFDVWCRKRDEREDRSASAAHVSRSVIGYEDLDSNGTWVDTAEYGSVWRPTVVAVDWAPYRFGAWRWIAPWGWTWVDDEPWGFAPFHYGRWAFAAGAWAWVPGPIAVRTVWAPHLVGFFGAGWSAGVAIGAAPVAWVPLGPRDPWVPVYRASPGYVRAVNPGIDVTVAAAFTNRSVVGAVTAVPGEVVASGRSVGSASVSVPATAVASAPVGGFSPAVVPHAEAVASRFAGDRPVARPPAGLESRGVQAQRAPAPTAALFATQQKALAASPGRPLARSASISVATRTNVTPAANGPGGLKPKREGLRLAEKVPHTGFRQPAAAQAVPATYQTGTTKQKLPTTTAAKQPNTGRPKGTAKKAKAGMPKGPAKKPAHPPAKPHPEKPK